MEGSQLIATHPDACPQNHPCPAVRYCPAGAIIQESAYSAPRIDEDLCTDCGACTSVCARVFRQIPREVGVR